MVKYTVEMSKALASRLEARLERRAGEDEAPLSVEEGIVWAVSYALSRMDVLDNHRLKKALAKMALEEGKPLGEELTFRRYTPTIPDAEADAPGTERPVATWVHKAPRRGERAISHPARPLPKVVTAEELGITNGASTPVIRHRKVG